MAYRRTCAKQPSPNRNTELEQALPFLDHENLPLAAIDLFEDENDDEVENIAINAIVEMAEGFVQRRQRTCITDYIEHTLPMYSDAEFIMHFRLKRTLFIDIVDKFSHWPHFRNLGAHGGGFKVVSAEKHILTFLWFAGHQSASFRDVADRFDLSLSTLESVLRRVTQFLYDVRNEFIRYPTEVEKQRTQRYNLENKGFPGVIGYIDGSHIRIDKPSEDPVAYINRKHYFSVHMQGTVNEHRKFLDVFIGYPGSVHDARVFANSSLAEDLPALCQDRSVLLGDAAYPCLLQLITPYRDNGHLTQAQRNFNRIHSQCRIAVEHAFGILKQRFRQLYFLKLRNMEFIVKFIFACCVLHNLADLNDLQHMEEPNEDDDNADVNAQALLHVVEDVHQNPIDDRNGRDLRDELCRQLFQRQFE